MKIIELNINSGIRFLIMGIFVLFISFLFIPGHIKPGETQSSVPFIIFISGSVIATFGIIKIIAGIIKKFLK